MRTITATITVNDQVADDFIKAIEEYKIVSVEPMRYVSHESRGFFPSVQIEILDKG